MSTFKGRKLVSGGLGVMMVMSGRGVGVRKFEMHGEESAFLGSV